MKVTTEKPEPGVATLTIEIPAEDLDRAVDSAWRRVSSRVNIPGFRRGKAPRPLVERHVGSAAIDEEALRRLLPETYDQAVQESGLFPIDRPNFEIVQLERGKPLVYKATVPLRPTVEIGDYKSLTVEPEPVEVTDEQVDGVIERLRESQAQWLPVEDRGVEMGDMVIADITLTLPAEGDAEPTRNERKDSEVIIGENGYPKGFDEHLIGATVNDTREFTLNWSLDAKDDEEDEDRDDPAEGEETTTEAAESGEAEASTETNEAEASAEASEAEPQAGAASSESEAKAEGDADTEKPESSDEPEERSATFTVAIKEIKRKELPALDDDFAKSLGSMETFEELTTDVRRRLYAEALRAARSTTENKVVEAAVEQSTFEIPDRLVEAETDSLVQERERSMAQQGIVLERYLSIIGTSMEDFRKEQRAQALQQIKARVLLDEVADKEEIIVEPQEVAEEIEAAALSYGEQAAQVRQALSTEESLRRVATSLRRQKTIQQMVEYAGGYPADEMGVFDDEDEDEALELEDENEGSKGSDLVSEGGDAVQASQAEPASSSQTPDERTAPSPGETSPAAVGATVSGDAEAGAAGFSSAEPASTQAQQ